jgi:hypothetical protein
MSVLVPQRLHCPLSLKGSAQKIKSKNRIKIKTKN